MFVDRVRVHLRAGHGGAGVVSFQKLRGRPKGKAIGGSGGKGGAVILLADPSMATLLTYKRNPHHEAGAGTHGQGDLRTGKHGDVLVLSVPLGTVVRDEDGVVIADLVESMQQVTVLEGGRGGRGNASLVSRVHRAPNFCEQGEYGEGAWFELELKLLADAALVGFPNAGKSTLISRVSAARPKIADYPFTTLEPNLGVVSVAGREFVFADIPGLIEGAADGKGLGHEFLRHVERARALVILLDPSPLQTDSLIRQHDVLIDELARHSAELAERPRVIVVNKGDLPGIAPEVRALESAIGEVVHTISAITGEGIEPLLHAVADAVDLAVRRAPEREGFVLHRPVRSGFDIHREGDVWVIEGRVAVRAVGLDDLTKPEAADYAAARLARIGVDDALREAGAKPGDEVRIGDLVFEFQDNQ
ncbi:MAG: GTPase ObgE [Acidimicrobiia bacterium]|nr:GTPase ObgE [Acidimicrobiia bacterium]